MEKYNYHQHHPVTDEFVAGGRVYRKIEESGEYYFFKVTPETGSDYYEIFCKKGYTSNGKAFVSTMLNEGDHMYPTDKDFGVWAWCYSDYDYALERWNEKNSINS